jgi:hypothetical protein
MSSILEKDPSFIKKLTELIAEGQSYHQIEKRLGVSRPSISKYAKLNGLHEEGRIKLKKHSLNVDYFNHIDTSEKAYVLGLLYADGCNTRKGLYLALAEEDLAVVEFVKTQLNASNSLRFVPAARTTWKNKWELSIKSAEFSKKLSGVGCIPAKSLVLEFPAFISDIFMSDFIRGFFDGDGSISCSKGSWRATITSGSSSFILKLQEFLSKKAIYTKLYKTGKNNACFSLHIARRSDLENFASYIYRPHVFSMKRKHDKAMMLFSKKGGLL